MSDEIVRHSVVHLDDNPPWNRVCKKCGHRENKADSLSGMGVHVWAVRQEDWDELRLLNLWDDVFVRCGTPEAAIIEVMAS